VVSDDQPDAREGQVGRLGVAERFAVPLKPGRGVTELLHIVADPSDKRVPEVARACLAALGTQLLSLSTAQPQGADLEVRSDDHGLAPVQPNEQTPSLHSRGRSDAGDRSGRECR
jgi:hypothetical protein